MSIGPDAIGVLKEQRKKVGREIEYVFPSPSGGAISPDSVLNMLHRVLERAGLPKIRFHDLRHFFATLALQNGVDIKTVSGMLGHFSAGLPSIPTPMSQPLPRKKRKIPWEVSCEWRQTAKPQRMDTKI